MRTPERTDGFAPIEDYAAIGDGRVLALVALDGSIDWLCVPEMDAPPIFSRLLDPENGGCFVLQPAGDFEVERWYADDSNVLETVFSTSEGTVKVVDALLLDGGAILPWSGLVRRIECLEGKVSMQWRVEVRPRWGRVEAHAEMRQNVALVEWDTDAVAILNYDCGEPKLKGPDVRGAFELEAPHSTMLAALYFNDEPYAVPPRRELEALLTRTAEYWQTYSRDIPYDGPWRQEVRRGVLAQRLLTHAPTGAIAAAATTSLPEKIGGDRNWDYRFSWVRDTSLALESLLAAQLSVECQRSLDWVVDATRQNGQLQPMYTLRGETDLPREDIDVPGYRGSKPVRVGNDAQDQLQLGSYADVIDAAYRFCTHGHILDPRTAQHVGHLADEVCRLWPREDAGIWEIDPAQYTQSNIAAWAALDHAITLADDGRVPGDNTKTWKSHRQEIADWIETKGWSETRGAYVMKEGSDDLDASVLLAARWGYADGESERFAATIDAIRSELSHGPFLWRTTDLKGKEGCFLACSFWLVDALARCHRLDEARELMEQLLPAANDVGLYSEQIDPETGAALGNTPQALTHLSLILAAVSVMRAERDAI